MKTKSFIFAPFKKGAAERQRGGGFFSTLVHYILTLLAGALLPFAFAPYKFYFLAIVSTFLFYFSLQKKLPKPTFHTGLLYGLGCFGVGTSWIYISIHNYGNSNIFIGLTITILFVVVLALFPALHALFLQKFFPESKFSSVTRSLIVFPALGALLEWGRSYFCTGFPWLLLGHSQIQSPLAGYAPLVGVYGTTFLVFFSSGLIYLLLKYYKKIVYFVLFSVLLIVLNVAGYFLSFIQWTSPVSSPLNVSLIQGNIPLTMKWSEQYALKSFSDYVELSKNSFPQKPNHSQTLILWPETAVTFFLDEASPLLTPLDQYASDHNTAIITGIPIHQNNSFYNGVVALGKGNGVYLKRHLVPFGEFTPFQDELGRLLNFMDLPMSNFSKGPEKQNLINLFNIKAAALICYEVAYPDILRADLPQANILVGLSNDSWFGKSNASAQQRQIAQFAALSSRREMIIATNSGETVIIDSHGKIVASAPINKTIILQSQINPLQGATPWIKIGDFRIMLFLLFVLFFIQLKRLRKNSDEN